MKRIINEWMIRWMSKYTYNVWIGWLIDINI